MIKKNKTKNIKDKLNNLYSITELKKSIIIIFLGFILNAAFLLIIKNIDLWKDKNIYKITNLSFYDENNIVFLNLTIFSKENIDNCEILLKYSSIEKKDKINLSKGINHFFIPLPDIPFGNSKILTSIYCEK